MNTNEELKNSIIHHFVNDSYKNGELDRKYLASIVFNNKEKLELLNSLTHPVTIRDAEEWMNRQTSPYCIKEAALLFESGAAEHLDYVIGVYAPQHIRVKRVMDRDDLTTEEVMKRISRQVEEEMKMKLCDFIITNNDQQLVIPQVLELDKKLRTIV
jgi:dephospho-CoA kinase